MARHRLVPRDLSTAPEMAVLALLNSVIDMSIRSLLEAHPHLHDGAMRDEDSFRMAIARTIVISASQLREPLDAYRKVVSDTEVNAADLPF